MYCYADTVRMKYHVRPDSLELSLPFPPIPIPRKTERKYATQLRMLWRTSSVQGTARWLICTFVLLIYRTRQRMLSLTSWYVCLSVPAPLLFSSPHLRPESDPTAMAMNGQVKAQDAITESKSRSAQLVRQDTKTIDAVANAQVTVNLATARANGKVQLAQKTAQGTKTVQEAKYSGVSALAKQLGLSAKDLNRFLYLRSLRMQGKGTALMVDVADRTVMTKELR